MKPLDLFSKRGKPLPDVLVYNRLPPGFRHQIVHLFRDVTEKTPGMIDVWPQLSRSIACEHELPHLPSHDTGFERPDAWADCMNYFLTAKVPHALDVIEVSMRAVEVCTNFGAQAISTLNHRFREHGCGFEYTSERIIRIDSQLLHTEAVQPAIAFLADPTFAGPNKEFLRAHDHLRHGRFEEALTDACKAFESVMKVICAKRKWTYDARATADQLIQVVIAKGLIPKHSEEQLQNLRKCLVGLATVRNKNGGHGAGEQPRDVPLHYAAYALHLAASNIVFLIECHKALR